QLMTPTHYNDRAPVPPPAYHRMQARQGPALHIDALTIITMLPLLALCRLAVRVAHRRCPPPLPAGPGGAPRTYSAESLLLIALLRTLWRLSRPGTCMTGCGTGLPWRWPVASQLIATDSHAFPARPNNANAVVGQGRLCTSRSSCLWSSMACDDGSLEPVTSSLIGHPFWLGDVAIPMQPLGMLLLSIHAPYYWAIGCIPYSVAVQGSPSSCLVSPGPCP
ncbi:MAG TPA: hypothetical protein VIY29_09250, partial [Ktedonobacteraceae bacterium]